jgi:Ca2+-transporting ATPase
MFASTAMNLPSPLSPIQILLINIVMDGPPALALGVEPASKHVMRQPPRPPKEQLLSMRIVVDVLVYGLFIAAGCLYIFREYLLLPGSSVAEVESLARTAVFALFVLFQLFLAFGSRTHRTSVFSTSFWSNRWLLASVAASAAMLGAVVLTDAGAWLGISRLPLEHAARLTVIASSVFFLTEARKAVSRFRRQAFD